MNTLLKGLIVTLASVFGFALIAAGVSVGLAPTSDNSPVKHDKVLVKRDDDSAPVAAVIEDDDNSPDDNNGFDPSTRNRNHHGVGAQAHAQAFDDHGGLRAAGGSDDNGMATAGTNTNTGAGTNTGTGGVNAGRSANSGHNGAAVDNSGSGSSGSGSSGSGSSGSGSSGSGSSGGGNDDGINHDLNDD